MNQGHSRSTDTQKGKDQEQGKDRGKTRGKRTDIIHTREMVFSLSPYLLKAFIDLNNFSEDDELDDTMTEGEELASKDEAEQETDIEAKDEEEESETVQGDESQPFDYDTLFGSVSLLDDSAVLLKNAVYAITLAPALNGRYHCWFEGPSWFSSKLSPEIQTYVNKLKTFLDALAYWLETEKQAFLQTPSPENFVQGEADFFENPVVMQKGLLQRINKRIVDELPFSTKDEYEKTVWTEKGKTFPSWSELDETQFSRLLDKIWLLWPDWNMPLANIFSSSFHLPWLVEVGTALYSEAGVEYLEPELEYPTFGDKDLADIRSMDFSTLMPEEKLHLLCSHFKKGVEMARASKSEISARISRGNNG